MMKNLRMFCLGLAAATFTASFAQTNVTEKLLNADMEKGVLGWNIKFESNIWKKQKKSQSSYHGFNGVVLENWKSDATTGLTDNTISQSLSGLPNGTYVFGAYIAAAKKDSVENREVIEGVNLFANDATTPVATNWPEHTSQKWSHTAKFNVAVTVTDGTLNVGLEAKETNANFLIWDNATLYYFGETAPAAALDQMAKIDLAASVALADTCKAHKMQVDTLAALNEQIAAAKAVTGEEGAYEADENLWWAFRQARASINDYRNFNNTIKAAEKIAGMEWSAVVAKNVEALNELIAAAKATHEAATADRAELNEKKTELTEAAAYVELDSAYTKIDIYTEIIDNIEPGEDVGEYSEEMKIRMEDILEEVGEVLAASDNGLAATVAKHRCDSLYALVEDVLANPISFDTFPIDLVRDENTSLGGYTFLKGTYRDSTDVNTYESRLFRFQFPLSKVRFIVKGTGSNGATGGFVFFTLSSFEMFDEAGKEIELSANDITSNACHNTLNGSPDGQGIGALVDDDNATYFHTTWGTVVNDHHYIEVSLPEGKYNAFSFKMRARGSSQNHQFPATIQIAHLSEAVANLQSVVATASSKNAYQGTTPGFYKEDLTSFNNALAVAEELVATESTDEAAIAAAIATLEDEYGKVDEMKPIMPEEGKEYRIISAGPFFAQQHVMKALSVYSDTAVNNRIYWETASVDSAQQVFTFEKMENAEGRDYYHVKHVATGKYISDYIGFDGDVADNNAHGLSETPDTVELISLGYGQFALANGALAGNNSNWIHAGGHSSGAGKKAYTVKWNTEANNSSAWFIREMQVLPFNAKSLSDLNFETTAYSLYKGVNSLTLTADKDCAFADFKLYGIYGEEIAATPVVSGASAMIVLDSLIESFSFSFTNTEKVAVVAVNAEVSKLSELQEAYDAAVAVAPTKGTRIGQYADLSEYEAALAAAEAILANGGSEDAIVKAANDLDSAVVHLEPNLPLADKEYFIVSAYTAFQDTHGVDMALYAKTAADGTVSPAWTYVGVTDPAYLWKFEEGERTSKGKRAFYLKNVGTEMYMGWSGYLSTALTMEPSAADTRTFRIDIWNENELTICESGTTNGNLHFNGHSSGASAYGNIVYWSSTTGGASSLFIVEAEEYIYKLTDIENIDVTDEYVAPAVQGIFDLYGRRVMTPAATGIYIVDGKKRVIKK